ncbi:MAG: M1 family metallopeptidase [Chloroflexi bacterium]|nr:M1 family metallopeptidase [Chloroflexota bacterium]
MTNRAQIFRDRRWRYGAGGGLFLLLCLVLFLLKSYQTVPEKDSVDRFRPAMKPEFESQLDGLAQAPRYAIDIRLDPKLDVLSGQATVRVVNTSTDPWPYLVFRLYPMLGQYGGKMTFQSVAIGKQPMPYVNLANNSAIRVNLPEPLAPQEKTEVRLVWKLDIPEWTDSSNTYALLGKSQAMLSLPLFYPALAVYTPGPIAGSGQWWLEEGDVRGDAALNVTSLFVVTATLPSDQIPVTSGTLITSTLLGKNMARHVWVTGPSREFLLHTSTQFSSASADAYGTRITSYWLPGQDAAGKAVLNYAVAALRIYSDRFGPYPYRDLRLAPAALSYRSMEYPQAGLLGIELYSLFRNNLESIVARSVAHQWWYQVVGSDPVNEPWLDESLAEYSAKLYTEELYGKTAADELQIKQWQGPFDTLKQGNSDVAMNQPVRSFASNDQYEAIMYAKGPLFYDALRKTMGDPQFTQFLQDYVAKYRYQIVDSSHWLTLLHSLNNPALDKLYQSWVQSPSNQP